MRTASPSRTGATSVVVLASAVAVALAGCSEPRAEDPLWGAEWDAVVALVPDLTEITALDDPSDRCADVLGDLREARPLLAAAPEPALDGPVTTWFDVAETTFFECPPDGEQINGFGEAYSEMERLEAEIDAVLPSRGAP